MLHTLAAELRLHSALYRLCIEGAAIALLCYIGFTDFRSFKIPNKSVLLLLLLYVPYAAVARSSWEIVSDVVLAALVFTASFWFYAKGVVGGGDVKFIAAACLWVGPHCALPFCAFLLVFLALHLGAVRLGWAAKQAAGDRYAIPYAPSFAAAVVATILLGCS